MKSREQVLEPEDRMRWGVLGATLAAWLVSFALVGQLGTWLTFVAVGPLLVFAAIRLDSSIRELVTLSWRNVVAGLLAGVAMVLLTHLLFSVVVQLYPPLYAQTNELYALLNVAGYPPIATAALVALVAISEEFLFRGSIVDSRLLGTRGLLALAVFYALSVASSGSILLIATAFLCGLTWGGLRIATRGVVAPAICHVIWDLGVLVAWPLATSH